MINSSMGKGVKDLAVKFGGEVLKLEPRDGSFGGFANYLTRVSAAASEDSDESIVVFSPWSGLTCEHLSEEKKIRYRLKDKLSKAMTSEEKYVAVLFEPDVPDLDEFSDKVLLLSDREKMRLGSILMDEVKGELPSFEPFFAIWHIGQVVEGKNGENFIRTPHFHFVMKQVAKRRTDKEIKLLEG